MVMSNVFTLILGRTDGDGHGGMFTFLFLFKAEQNGVDKTLTELYCSLLFFVYLAEKVLISHSRFSYCF